MTFDREILDRLYRYCFVLTGQREDAEDLLHSALESYIRNRPEKVDYPVAYIRRIARNRYFDRLRKLKVVPFDTLDERKPLRLQFKRLLEDERMNDRQFARIRKKLEGSGEDWAKFRNEQGTFDWSGRTNDYRDTNVPGGSALSGSGRTSRIVDVPVPTGRSHHWSRVSWIAAAMILVIITSLFVMRIFTVTEPEPNVSQMIAEEVATNHIIIKHPDLETSSMEEIRVFFDRLDFVPAGSELIDWTSYVLRGARYCTLQGKIAAHLMFDSPLGDNVSHYQAAYDPVRFGPLPDIDNNEAPWVITNRGVEVEIWVERDLLMARARTI